MPQFWEPWQKREHQGMDIQSHTRQYMQELLLPNQLDYEMQLQAEESQRFQFILQW